MEFIDILTFYSMVILRSNYVAVVKRASRTVWIHVIINLFAALTRPHSLLTKRNESEVRTNITTKNIILQYCERRTAVTNHKQTVANNQENTKRPGKSLETTCLVDQIHPRVASKWLA